MTKVEKDTLTLKDDAGKDKSFIVPDTAKVTIDGKDGVLQDVKEDSTVTVTSKGDEVTKVEAKAPAAPPPPPEAKTLWDRLGGEANVAKVVDDFVNTAGKDPKVNFWRDPTKVPSKEEVAALKKHLVEFVSSATGGPLKYEGKSMKEVHKGMKITNAEFDAAAKDLQEARWRRTAPCPTDEKAVMAAVEGTRKDIVEDKAAPPPTPPDKDKPAPPDKDKPPPRQGQAGRDGKGQAGPAAGKGQAAPAAAAGQGQAGSAAAGQGQAGHRRRRTSPPPPDKDK